MTHKSICECGKPTTVMSETEYAQYISDYGNDCPLTCDWCSIETLRLAGWEPEDFAKYTPDLARLEQRRLANELFKFKRVYRRISKAKATIHHDINRFSREIRVNTGNPFFEHMKGVLTERIDRRKDLLTECPAKGIQDIIFGLMELFDRYGTATAHDYATILSTSHVHVEKALAEDGVKGLMHLVVHHVEDGANVGDSISDGCILHECSTAVIIREMMSNKALRESANKILDDICIEATGRPLARYYLEAGPNGETVAKRAPPKLAVVK